MRPRGRVHLTFDDGPDPVWTPRIATELERAGARGTFFVVGERAAAHPAVVQELAARGHEVELHCMCHVRHPDSSKEEIDDDVVKALDVLSGLGIRPSRWRPPGGALASWTRPLAHRHGLRIAGWSIDPRDWEAGPTGEVLARIAPQLRPGAVIVMHDAIGPGARRTDCSQTVELIEPLVDTTRGRGLRPAPLGSGGFSARALDAALYRLARRAEARAARAADDGVEIELVSDGDLTREDVRALSELLAGAMSRNGSDYAARPWRLLRPEFRAIASNERGIVGQVSAFPIATRPPRRLYGLGDLAVLESERGRGIADRLGSALREECWRRDAEILLTDADPDRAHVWRRGGWAPVPRFRFYYERDGACHWHETWFAAIRHPEPRARLELEEGEF